MRWWPSGSVWPLLGIETLNRGGDNTFSLLYQPFCFVQLNAHDNEFVPFSVHSPSDVSTSLCFFIDTDIVNTNSVYGKGRRKNFRSLCVLSLRRPSDSQPLEKPAKNTCNRTTKTSEIAVL